MLLSVAYPTIPPKPEIELLSFWIIYGISSIPWLDTLTLKFVNNEPVSLAETPPNIWTVVLIWTADGTIEFLPVYAPFHSKLIFLIVEFSVDLKKPEFSFLTVLINNPYNLGVPPFGNSPTNTPVKSTGKT